ncbi:MAG TPA: hypothetical protein VN711_00695 [Candidatus Saccharimonadales bacterium]|nr:hypothetical protein [Candidatus Saccharimonadales bacterium]
MGRIVDRIRYFANMACPVAEITQASREFPASFRKVSDKISQEVTGAPTAGTLPRDSGCIMMNRDPRTGERLSPPLRRPQQVEKWLRVATEAAGELDRQEKDGLHGQMGSTRSQDRLEFQATIDRLHLSIYTIQHPSRRERLLRHIL